MLRLNTPGLLIALALILAGGATSGPAAYSEAIQSQLRLDLTSLEQCAIPLKGKENYALWTAVLKLVPKLQDTMAPTELGAVKKLLMENAALTRLAPDLHPTIIVFKPGQSHSKKIEEIRNSFPNIFRVEFFEVHEGKIYRLKKGYARAGSPAIDNAQSVELPRALSTKIPDGGIIVLILQLVESEGESTMLASNLAKLR